MHPAKNQELANAPIAGPRRRAERDPVTYPARQARQVRHRYPANGFGRRLCVLLASMDFQQLAGSAAVFFLWPPRPRRRPATAQDHRPADP
jgi:hypothetical protein